MRDTLQIEVINFNLSHGRLSGARQSWSRRVAELPRQAELWAGVALLPEGARKHTLEASLADLLDRLFGGRLLDFDRRAARAYAEITRTTTALRRFEERFTYRPNTLTIDVRQGLELLDAAFAAGHTSPEAVKGYLLSGAATHATSLGAIVFDAHGDVSADYHFTLDPRHEIQ